MPAEPQQTTISLLATEAVNPATEAIDRMSPLEIVQAMNAEDARVAAAVAREAEHIAAAIEATAARLRQGGRLIYTGAGTSGRLGALDAAECPPTFSVPADRILACVAGGPGALAAAAEDQEDSDEAGAGDLRARNVTAADVVVGIAASGRTPYVLGALAEARARGALTIGLVCNTGTPVAALSDILIAPQVGPEVIAGSTRLKAGTAQKMVLNMLSTGAMVLLGKTYGNLMVDVRATNEKLRVRAAGIVSRVTGLAPDEALRLVDAADGEAKTAIVMERLGIPAEEARERLEAQGGCLRATLQSLTDAGA